MVSWHPQQYLKFADERSRPCFDLIQRVHVASPQTIIDLGCGPGNSTAALAQRWPEAHITGLDSSSDMIDAARRLYPKQHWIQGDIATWTAPTPVDLIFSNAAFQWVKHHTELLPRLLGMLNPGGALAIQMPANYHTAPAQILMRDLAAGAPWNTLFPGDIRKWQCHEPAFYYDLLSGAARNIDLWTSEYIHIFRGPEQIVEWYKGTGLRPYLDMLPLLKQQTFLAAYQTLITQAYPPRSDGRILFPFRRLFLIAYR
jgi:trans-aconitate 2-methyltransferase